MQTKKMSLDNIQGKLSRAEMKNIMAGTANSGDGDNSCNYSCLTDNDCRDTCTSCEEVPNWPGKFCVRP